MRQGNAMPLQLEFSQAPSFSKAYRRVLFSRRRGMKPGDELPAITATWKGAHLDAENLQAYRDVCQITSEPGLPIHYPHVLISPLHITMLTEPEYPLPLLGAVHLRNHAIRYRTIEDNETLDLTATIAGHRFCKQGIETDVDSWATVGDEVVWRERTTFLTRKKGLPDDPASSLADVFPWPDEEAGEEHLAFNIGAKTGKRYAKISGDYNPIHISKWMAKMFGFKRDIAHGMWGVARATADLPELATDGPVRLDVMFKGPLFMTKDVVVRRHSLESGTSLRLFVGSDPRPAMLVTVRPTTPDALPETAPA
ncbi:MAG: hypothetical protein EP343_27415 [Deltaproteobacteria bacterium]|nr:MAG: hypothetical protein EP343_27415 [Deltaproteobacteria bacterium]